MMLGRDFRGNGFCLENGFMGSGWHLLVMAGVLLLIVAVIIYFTRKSNDGAGNNQAIELLKMKFVQGEITEEEYLTKKETLVGKTLKRK